MNAWSKYGAAVAALVGLVLAGSFVRSCEEASRPPIPLVTPHPPQVLTKSEGAVLSNASSKTTVRLKVSQEAGSDDRSFRSRDQVNPGASGPGSTIPAFLGLPEGSGDVSIFRSDQSKPKLNEKSNGLSIIEIEIETIAQATASATASNEVSTLQPGHLTGLTNPRGGHGKLGVIVGPFPGIAAADFQLARVTIPSWAIGTDLDVGLDVEANLSQLGGGVSFGGKGFVVVGAWTTWTFDRQGVLLGAGLRF